jgi:CheY-like chemotaxis protein
MIASKALPVVLVVEDDPLLRMLAVEVVEEAGFIAIEARDADEAVILLESRTDIALLFTDINMPGSMDGLKLAHAVRDRWPPINRVRKAAASVLRSPVEQLLCRKALPGIGVGRGTSIDG